MRKAIIMILALLLLPASASAAAGTRYTDMKDGNWAFEAVSTMSEKAIVKGYPDGSFRPGGIVTYGEFIKMAFLEAGGPDPGNAASGHWATAYYEEALKANYFTTVDIDKSQLGDPIDRAHMALLIGAILGDVTVENYDALRDGIADVDYRTEYEYSIMKSYSGGILTGYSDNTFRPKQTLSRAEAAMVIYRLADESKRVYPGEAAAAPKTTQERLLGESDSGTVNLADSSDSTLLLDSLVTNRSDFRLLERVKYYEIVEDYPYEMSKQKSLIGEEGVILNEKDYSRSAFIIRNSKLVMLESTAGYIYSVSGVTTALDFPEFDYIGFYNTNHDTVILVPNPF